jgi:hypothetical protein
MITLGSTSSIDTAKGRIIATTPTMKQPLKMLLPRIFPKLTSSCPRIRATSVVANSGVLVAIATTTAPTTNSLQPKAAAMPLPPSTTK